MLDALDAYGNPASVHGEGRDAHRIVEQARADVGKLIGASTREIVFTSGATEANNWVMQGAWDAVVVCAVEHASVLEPAARYAGDCRIARVDAMGRIDLAEFEATIAALLPSVDDGEEGSTGAGRERVRVLVSAQGANSETGVVQPLRAVRDVLDRYRGALLHVDAVQLRACHADLLDAAKPDFVSLSAHKIGGPKGAGALYVRAGLSLEPMIVGGGQELRRRSGTVNVAAVAGFGAAARACSSANEQECVERLVLLRDEVERGVREVTPDVVVVGEDSDRLCNTSCLCVPGVRGETLVMALDLEGVAVSSGSACSSGKVSTSHVLLAMGLDEDMARSSVRVSLGWSTTDEDVERFLSAWRAIASRVLNKRDVGAQGLKFA